MYRIFNPKNSKRKLTQILRFARLRLASLKCSAVLGFRLTFLPTLRFLSIPHPASLSKTSRRRQASAFVCFHECCTRVRHYGFSVYFLRNALPILCVWINGAGGFTHRVSAIFLLNALPILCVWINGAGGFTHRVSRLLIVSGTPLCYIMLATL